MNFIFKKNEIKTKNKYIIIIIIIVFISLCNKFKKKNLIRIKEKNKNTYVDDININELKNYFKDRVNKTKLKLEGKIYINNCLNKKDLGPIYKIQIDPVISSIIPVYNSESTIYNSICSIQNQIFTNFEIILIDDFSNDSSYKIIRKLQKKDNRIKLLKNKKNKGALFCRCIGVLISKGEFIIPLDNDDMFFNQDIFKDIFKFAKKFEFDIVAFRAFKILNYQNSIDKIYDLYNYEYYPEFEIVHQPLLSKWMINKNGYYSLHDVTIWGKCIKSKIYKEAIINLGIKRYSIFVTWYEDTIINFIIFNYAQTFIFINKYGIIHLQINSTATFTTSPDLKLFGEIFLIDIIFDFSKNNTDKNYAVLAANWVKTKFPKNNFKNDTNFIYFKSILKKILNSQYISIELKNQIKINLKSFLI